MAKLKKPMALAVFSASVLASFASPANLIAQSTSPQESPSVEGRFVQDSLPFAKPYSPDRQAKKRI